MHCFTAIDFVAHVSRSSPCAYMVVTVDPGALRGNSDYDGEEVILDALEGILDSDAALMVSECCATTIMYDSVDEAYPTMARLERAIPAMEDIGLVASVFCRGKIMLSARQDGAMDPELSIAPGSMLM